MINPFRNRRVLPWLCAAFMKILDSCGQSLHMKTKSTGALVLQIVPLNLVASLEGATLPPAKAYSRLAREVYNRCGSTSTGGKRQDPQYQCAPAIRLARSIPKAINFRLTPNPSTALLQSDRCFHLSYSWSFYQDWLTASWTDNPGVLQWNATYNMGKEVVERWQIFVKTAREIWNTTLDIFRPGSAPWRIFIAKDSPMHREELRGRAYIFPSIIYPGL